MTSAPVRRLAALLAAFALWATPLMALSMPCVQGLAPALAPLAGADEAPCRGAPDSAPPACKVHCENGLKNPASPLLPPVGFVAAFRVALEGAADVAQRAYAAFQPHGLHPPPAPRPLVLRI
jgi:hypothetical protein